MTGMSLSIRITINVENALWLFYQRIIKDGQKTKLLLKKGAKDGGNGIRKIKAILLGVLRWIPNLNSQAQEDFLPIKCLIFEE